MKLARRHRDHTGQYARAAQPQHLNRRVHQRVRRAVADFSHGTGTPSHHRAIDANRQAVVRAGRYRHRIRKIADATRCFHENAIRARQGIAKRLKPRAIAKLAAVVEPPRHHRSERRQLEAESGSDGNRHRLLAERGRDRAVLRNQRRPIA